MKKLPIMKMLLPLFILSHLFCLNLHAQSVAINADGSPPDGSAMLDVKSTTKGILIPRMSTVERTAIATPATGLLVFDNDAASFWFHNGINWIELGSGGAAGSWAANGADIYNNNTGNVGIGTIAPTEKLTIVTGFNTNGWSHIGEQAGSDPIILTEGIGGVSASIGTTSNHAFRISTAGEAKLNIYPAGEVVVGSRLTGSFGKLTVETLNNSYGISHLGEGGNILATRMGGTTAGIGTFSATDMRIFSGGFSRVFISQTTGGVFIGTDNPAVGTKLTVQTLNNSDGISHVGENGNVLSTRIGGTSAGIGTFSNTHMRLFCNGRSDLFIAAATGNVGIGTENFGTYKLAVNGNIRTKEVVVETGWADYVFDKSYKLAPLAEVEKFIKQNGHLPNIPAAREVEEKGLHVGDVQKRMMEKIEELTLYMIELNKLLEEAKKEITTLKSKPGCSAAKY